MSKRILLFFLPLLLAVAALAQPSLTTSSTQNFNCRGVDCVYNGPSILINEIMLSPSGGIDGSLFGKDPGSSMPQEGEWIELFNPDPCRSIDISCFYLGNAATDGAVYGGGFRIPDNTIVPPLGFVIIRGRNAAPVPTGLLLQNGGNTIEIVTSTNNTCIGAGGNRLWFPNAGGWFAFYNREGVPQDAINFGGDNQGDLGRLPCIARNGSCPNLPADALISFNAIPANRKTKIANTVTIGSNMTYKRMPDGGAWVTNTETAPRYGTCNGTCLPAPPLTCNGTVTVVASGGTPPYRYLWNDNRAQNKATATQLCAGTYCVTVTDAQGRTSTACATITDFAPTVTVSEVPDGCIDGPNSPVVGTPLNGVNGGIGVLTGPVNGGIFSPAGAGAGMHRFTYNYTDSAGCKGADTSDVVIFPLPLTKANTDKSIICLGDSVRLFGTGAQTYTWNKGVVDSVKFAPTLTDTYTVIGVDSNGCRKIDSVKVDVSPVSFAGLDTLIISCPDNTISIRNLLRQNQPIGTFAKKGNFPGALNTSTGDYVIPATMLPGIYTIYYLATPTAPCPPDTAEIRIDVKGKPVITNVNLTCSQDRTFYTVTFNISGGDSSTYNVSPFGGSISANPPYLYTSGPVPNLLSETFTVNDQFMCGDAIAPTFIDCSCETFAGTMRTSSPQNVCGPNPFDVKPFFNKDSVNDGNDRFRYYLHRGANQQLVGVLQDNTTGVFNFDPATMQYGVTYYISPVMADNASGLPDFNDVCLSIGRGMPVTWREIPVLTIGDNDTLCISNNTYYLKFNFSKGTAPFDVQLGESSVNGTINGLRTLSNAIDSIRFNPVVNTTYSVISYIDRYACVGGTAVVPVTANVDNPTVATILSGSGLCTDGVSTLPSLRINLSGDSSSYTVVVRNTLNNIKDSYVINKPGGTFQPTHYDPDRSITFLIDTVFGAAPSTCAQNLVGQVTIHPFPQVIIDGDSLYCEGDLVPIKLRIRGVGPWDIYSNDNQGGTYNFRTFSNRDTVHVLSNLAPGLYKFKVDSIVDRASGCAGYGGQDSALVTINPSPRVKLFVMNGALPQKSISYCVGSGPVTLRVDTLPDPNQSYQVRYSVIGNPNKVYPIITLTRANNTFQFDSLTPGVYRVWLENARDNSAAGCGGIGDTVVININPLPTLNLTVLDPNICIGTPARIQATVTGNPPIFFQLNESNGKDVVSYNPSGSGTFVFNVTPTDTGMVNYRASLLRDSSLPQCTNSTNAQVTFRVIARPTASIVGNGEWCEGTPYTIPVTVSGEASVDVNFTLNGSSFSRTFSVPGGSVSNTLPPGTYTANITTVRDNSPATCIGTGTGPFTIIIRPTPTANLVYNPNPVCLGEPVSVELSGQGNGPFAITVINDQNPTPQTITGISNGGIGTINTIARFGMEYTIVSISDNSNPLSGGNNGRCFNLLNTPYPIVVNPLPTVQLDGDTQVCPDFNAKLRFTFGNGSSPYRIDYTDGLVSNSATAFSTEFDTSHTVLLERINLAITQLIDGNGCRAPQLDSLPIKILPRPQPIFDATLREDCAPLTTRLINNVDNVVLSAASFSATGNSASGLADTLQVWEFPRPGAYDLNGTLVSEFGCVQQFNIPRFFLVNPNPVASFTYNPRPVTSTDNIITFLNQSAVASIFNWTLSDSANTILENFTSRNPVYEYNSVEENLLRMNLVATTDKGCVDSTFQFIRVEPDVLLHVPNTFTPNTDGENDVFLPIFSHPERITKYELLIFNRWGEVVFKTNDVYEAWDGKYLGFVAQMEVYSWKISYSSLRKAEAKRFFGVINLLK